MKKLIFLFAMDPFEKIDLPNDTSAALMMELESRGHRILCAQPENLQLSRRGVMARAKEVSVALKTGFHVHAELNFPVHKADAVFIRKDPPVDLTYLYMTHLLERVSGRVLMINSPRGIRDANEKLYPFQFKKWMPPSLAASDPGQILAFQNQVGSDLILKPLNEKGGSGIVLLKKKDARRNAIVQKATKGGLQFVLAQKFLKQGLTEGDKRILVWDGEIIGVFGRIPKKGEFRANLSLGGRLRKASVSPRERKMILEMKIDFKRRGLLFVGLDLIAGQVTEINVTSPAGITDINQLYQIRLERHVIDWLERYLRRKS